MQVRERDRYADSNRENHDVLAAGCALVLARARTSQPSMDRA
jgi:hypothetical protein